MVAESDVLKLRGASQVGALLPNAVSLGIDRRKFPRDLRLTRRGWPLRKVVVDML